MNIEQLKGKAVAILGVGMEGIALAQFLLNYTQNITLLDKLSEGDLKDRAKDNGDEKLLNILADNRFERQFGPDYLENLADFEIIFRSPGIPYLEAKIQEAKKNGAEISSQIKLFFGLCPCPIIGVTGTKGKGTTATLIFEMLKKSQISNLKSQTYNLKAENNGSHCEESPTKQSNQNRLPRPGGLAMTDSNEAIKQSSNVYLAGNIGEPAITLIDKLSKNDIVVLELSSFQLQDMDVSPHIAVVLNISSDHLDYHKDEAEYKESKVSIVKYQNKNDFAVINQDYLTSFEFASQTNAQVCYFSAKESTDEGAYVKKFQIPKSKLQTKSKIQNQKYGSVDLFEVVLRINGTEEVICRSDEVRLIGKHNLENIAAAAVVAKIAGADTESIKLAVKEFKGLPHRLEFVAEIDGVKFYNDSFATNPAPTGAAIKSFIEPMHIILGGSSKGADFSEMAKLISDSNVSSVNLIGVEAEKIEKDLGLSGYRGDLSMLSGDINQIVKEVADKAKSGEVVLFSPACASFDMFKNYKDRGEKFKEAVLLLK